jgi:hypothetical protein
MIPPPPPRWDWGSFIVYCFFCFFSGLITGLLLWPGIIPVLFGAGAGFFAAQRGWFEMSPSPVSPEQPRQ